MGIRTVIAPSLVRHALAAGLAIVSACGTGCGSDGSNLTPVTSVATATRIDVSPTTATVDIGGSFQLSATAYDAAGTPLQRKTIAWTSSAPAIATVTDVGAVTAVSAGSATITASTDGRSGTAVITVRPPVAAVGTITVNPAQQFQTMTGWEALMEIGQAECDPRAYATYKSALLDRAANEVGINRIRIGLRNGYENPTDQWTNFKAGRLTFNQWKVFWFQVVNDNNDPFVINPAGFNWGFLDYTMDELVIPLRQRLAARGEDLWLNVSYTGANSGQLHRDDAEEYAEFVLAAFQHIQQKYGFAPNSLELVNEPDIGTWTAPPIAQLLNAAKRRLNQNGFFPDFIGPSGSTIAASISYFDQMAAVSGVPQSLNEIAYHRYGAVPTTAQLQAIAQRAAQYGIRTAMLEHGGSGHEDLHADLTLANVSAWQQFGLAFCGDRDIGGSYFAIFGAALGSNSPDVRTGFMTKYLRQYFRYVALRAVRLGATSADPSFAPVAFRNANGKQVVVVKASAGGAFSVAGLAPGVYGIDYTTGSEYARALSDVTVSAGQLVNTNIPAAGVLTIFAR